jgi:hypothetical protein
VAAPVHQCQGPPMHCYAPAALFYRAAPAGTHLAHNGHGVLADEGAQPHVAGEQLHVLQHIAVDGVPTLAQVQQVHLQGGREEGRGGEEGDMGGWGAQPGSAAPDHTHLALQPTPSPPLCCFIQHAPPSSMHLSHTWHCSNARSTRMGVSGGFSVGLSAARLARTTHAFRNSSMKARSKPASPFRCRWWPSAPGASSVGAL